MVTNPEIIPTVELSPQPTVLWLAQAADSGGLLGAFPDRVPKNSDCIFIQGTSPSLPVFPINENL